MPVVAKNLMSQLKEEGWNIKDEFLEDLLQDSSMDYHSAVKVLLNTDLKQCGSACLPSDGKGKPQISTPIILQVSNVRNVSAPKANEESQTAPRMLRITLTDGTKYVHGIEYTFIKSLSLKTAPGTKLKLLSKINSSGGYLMLNPSNVSVVGGVVEELFEKWKLSQSVSKYSRAVVSDNSGGPPQWVPFGHAIKVERENNFKSLTDAAAKKENDDFEHQRQKAVSELTKDSSQKVFGGGKQLLDSNVQKIINSGGFTIEEAEWAIRKFKNDVPRAIQELRRIQFGEVPSHESTSPPEERGRGSRRGRGRGGKGRDNKGPDGSDDEMPDMAPSRPSRPASLFDYFEAKIRGDSDAPSLPVPEENTDSRPFRGRRGGRGRGRGRGRGNYQEKTNNSFNSDVLSPENWPSLGQEEEKESKNRPNNASNEASQQAQPVSPQFYRSQQQSDSRDHYNQPRARDNQQNYRGSQSTGKDYNARNYKQQDNYRDNQYNQRNYRDNQHNYRDNQQSYRSNQDYRGNNQQNYQENHQNYRTNQQNHQNYRTDQQDHQNYRTNQQDHQNYRTDHQNYRNDQHNYHDNHQNYHTNQQNYRDGKQSYYETQENQYRETRYPQQQYQQHKNETPRYSDPERENPLRRAEQPYYRRGMGRDMQRGSNTTRGYGRGAYGHQSDGGAYYSEGTQGSRSYERETSAKDRELIAQFQKSMVLGGFYEASPSYNSQNRNDYASERQQSYSSNPDQRSFQGSFVYHRGGDGTARRSRGPRRGRY